ncbi:hypothetical protein [Haloarcula sp. 1CSR25-25]|jgi:hypothetical protein|uniref:hypothetical protein n=1 Tax=Haloarcula sp. 1CSR25-25 TaxID=2862545 RepID=UPI0028A23723|nr:hypothetical protein [Haloarcula sp. 1CSR25-25]
MDCRNFLGRDGFGTSEYSSRVLFFDCILAFGMNWFRSSLVFLFFWVLVGQYVYRRANEQNRSSPELRGLFWGLIGILGAAAYLLHIRDNQKHRLVWIGVSVLLFTVWAVGTVGFWGVTEGFHLWAALSASVFILYWQFDIETGVE